MSLPRTLIQVTFDKCLSEKEEFHQDPEPERQESSSNVGLTKCSSCKNMVPDANICIYCGHWLGPALPRD